MPVSLGQTFTMPGALTIPLDLSTLELMHHYTNHTCFSIHGYHPDVAEIWKTVVPSIAFSSQAHFLVHAMLALSALHLSQCHSDSEPTLSAKYAYVAASHFDHAHRAFASTLSATPEADGLGSFITHHFLAIYCFSSSRSLQSPECLNFFRFHLSPFRMWRRYVDTPIGPMVLRLIERHRQLLCLEDNATMTSYPFLDCLSTIHLPDSGTPDSQEVMDPEVSEAYAKAVRATRRAALVSLEPDSDIQYVAWYRNVSLEYLEFLWERRPRALVIAAHYCAILSHTTASHPTPWWIPKEQRWQEEVANIRHEVGDKWEAWLPQDDWLGGMDPELRAWIDSVTVA